MIIDIEFVDDDWWQGKHAKTGEVGLFPATYVSLNEKAADKEEEAPAPAPAPSLPSREETQAAPALPSRSEQKPESKLLQLNTITKRTKTMKLVFRR